MIIKIKIHDNNVNKLQFMWQICYRFFPLCLIRLKIESSSMMLIEKNHMLIDGYSVKGSAPFPTFAR